ncbi:hypothetical protein P3W45_000999 [Vairimorpha bombi]|jgi:hypothetical protein
MLQLLVFTISTISCGLSPTLSGFPGLHHRDTHPTGGDIRYVDLLSCDRSLSSDAITTIYGSFPAFETQVRSPEAHFGKRHGDDDCHEAREHLVVAIERFKECGVLDRLAVEYLLRLFNNFIERTKKVECLAEAEFNYCGREVLTSPPCEVAAALINVRGYRVIFGLWLKKMSRMLADKCSTVSTRSESITLSQLYAAYTKIVVDTLLAKVNADRINFGQNSGTVVEKFFVAIPRNNVNNGLANPILSADKWVDPSSIEK